MTMPQFRKKLAKQMCNYLPYNCDYKGDSEMSLTTKRRKHLRGRARGSASTASSAPGAGGRAKTPPVRGLASRFSPGEVNLDSLKDHLHSFERKDNSQLCDVCGEKGAYYRCKFCNKAMHFKKGGKKEPLYMIACAADYHNESYFGLAKCDSELVSRDPRQWRPPTAEEKASNHEHICELRKRYLDQYY
jgi:hypothetical protein